MNDHKLILTGFHNQRQVNSFLAWYKEEGVQSSGRWFGLDDKLNVEFMATIDSPSTKWFNTTQKLTILD
jgi:hypothetical protein